MFKRTFGPPALILLLTCNGASAADKASAAAGSQKPLSATEQLALIRHERAAAHARHQAAQAAAAASTAAASLVPATSAVAAPAPTTANTAPLSLKRPRDTEATASSGCAAAAQRIRYAAPTGAAAAGSSSGADDVEYIGDTAGVRPPDATREEVLIGSAASGGGYALGAGAEQAAIDASLAAITHCGSCNELLPSGPDEKMQLDCTHWICCACVESYNTIGCQHCPVSVRRGTALRAGNIVVDGSDDDDDADLAAGTGAGAAPTGGGSASGAGGADASGAGDAKPAVPEKNCCIQ